MILRWPPAALLLSLFTFLLSFVPSTVHADADFESVRVGLSRTRSGKAGDPKEKYFHESTFHPHYDGRFAEKKLGDEERKSHLVALVQTYLSTMADLGAETWLMHGTLMGWWWNRKILPWDSDIDVQMSIDTLSFLAQYYNMSVFHYTLPHIPSGRDYLFEINPGFATTDGPFDRLNMIDARWIDMETGLFIDITTVRPNVTARAIGIEGALRCKDRHTYLEKDLFPLRDSVFEGANVKIPFEYAYLLEEEYSAKSLTRTEFALHKFNEKTMEWEPLPGARRPNQGQRPVMKLRPQAPPNPAGEGQGQKSAARPPAKPPAIPPAAPAGGTGG